MTKYEKIYDKHHGPGAYEELLRITREECATNGNDYETRVNEIISNIIATYPADLTGEVVTVEDVTIAEETTTEEATTEETTEEEVTEEEVTEEEIAEEEAAEEEVTEDTEEV